MENKEKTRDFLGKLRALYMEFYDINFEMIDINRIKALNIEISDWQSQNDEILLRKEVLDNEMFNKMKTVYLLWGNRTLEYNNDVVDILLHFKLRNDVYTNSAKTNGKPEKKENQVVDSKKIDKKNMQFNEVQKDIIRWYENGVTLKNLTYIKVIIRDMFRYYIDWNKFNISKYLLDNYLNSNYINIEDSSKVKKGFQLERTLEVKAFFIGIIAWKYLGENSWGFENFENYYVNVYKYLEKKKENFVNEIFNENLVNRVHVDITKKMLLDIVLSNEDRLEISDLKHIVNKSIKTCLKLNNLVNTKIQNGNIFKYISSDEMNIFNLVLGDAMQSSSKLFLDIYEYEIIIEQAYNELLKDEISVNENYPSKIKENISNIKTMIDSMKYNYKKELEEIDEITNNFVNLFGKNEKSRINENLKFLTYTIKKIDSKREINFDSDKFPVINIIKDGLNSSTENFSEFWKKIIRLGKIDNYFEFYNNINNNYRTNKEDIIELNNVSREFIKLKHNYKRLIENSNEIKDHNNLLDRIDDKISEMEGWC